MEYDFVRPDVIVKLWGKKPERQDDPIASTPEQILSDYCDERAAEGWHLNFITPATSALTQMYIFVKES